MDIIGEGLSNEVITKQVVEGLKQGEKVTVLRLTQDQKFDVEVSVYDSLEVDQDRLFRDFEEDENGWRITFSLCNHIH